MLDLNLLRLLKHRKEYQRLHRTVNDRAFDIRTTTILQDFGKFFDEFPDATVIPLATDFPTFFTLQHRTLTEEAMATYRPLFAQCVADLDDNMKALVVGKLLEADLAVKLADLADKWTRGEEVQIGPELRRAIDDYEADVQRKVTIPFVEIGDNLFKDAVNNAGIRFRQESLNLTMRPLRPGDFGILGARPDAGKTSFVASEVTYWAHQIPSYFENPNRPIIWFNNEGPGDRIQERIIQAALGLPASQLVAMQKAGTLWTEYAKMVGDLLRIRVIDIHGYKAWQVEEIVKQLNPAVIVFDMIDNIQFDGAVMNGGQRTDQMLEAMYQWARIMCTQHKCIGIATSQISNDGEGLAFPTLGMLKDSKTGKQGAADFIITLGKKSELAYESLRFIGLTKNKLRQEGRPQSPRAEVVFNATECRFLTAREGLSVDPDDGRGDDDENQLQAEGKSVRPSQLGGVDGGEAAKGDGGLPADQRTGADQGLAGEDAIALLT